jgi:hypothetical protein
MRDETVWLKQDQMSQLFDKSKSTINEHIKNIYTEKELLEEQTMRKFGNSEFSTKPTNYYNLDMIFPGRTLGTFVLKVLCQYADRWNLLRRINERRQLQYSYYSR